MKRQHGVALIVALLVVALAALLIAALLDRGELAQARTRNSLRATGAVVRAGTGGLRRESADAG